MECITDNQAIIFLVLAFIAGFGSCFIIHLRETFKDVDDDFMNRNG
jgi:type IV secretory pathway TrbL component